MTKKSPMQRTLQHYRDLGYEIDITERQIIRANRKKDLFGFIDAVAVASTGKGRMDLIQTTTDAHVAERRTKILDIEKDTGLISRLAAVPGVRVILQGWKPDGRLLEFRFLGGAFFPTSNHWVTKHDHG